MTKFTIPPSSRVQAPKKPAPKKKPAFPAQRDAKATVYKAKPIRRGRGK